MKFKMKSMGVKRDEPSPIAVSAKKTAVNYPSLSLSPKNIEGLRDVKVGDVVELHIEARVKGVQEGADRNSKEGVRCDFELVKGCMECEDPEDMEDAANQAGKMKGGDD